MKRNLHDEMFKAVMNKPEIARDLFMQQYPAEVINKLDFNTLTRCPDTFTDEVTDNDVVVDVLFQEYYHRNPEACEENIQNVAAALSDIHV